jgi:hypothetical protein
MRTAEIRQFGFDVVDRKKHDDDEDEPTDDDALDHPDECPDCSARGVECPYGPHSEYR